MAAYVNGNSHHHNEDAFDTKTVAAVDSNSISTVDKILGLTSYSSRLEEVLLALLKEQQILKDKVESDMQGLNSRYGSLYVYTVCQNIQARLSNVSVTHTQQQGCLI